MGKAVSEFSGEAGRIYVEKASDDGKPYEVWFEDFFILGLGKSEIEALKDAKQNALEIAQIADDAIQFTVGPSGRWRGVR